ncbi:Hypothetical protein SRAE_2000138800 [Strongyloides ratti]|uniref:Uncharacterized protein n=1 Tax=Strongyloides ratti TaxID=34506 RepID=A0A090LAE0_STRRB|nr:Hypothetical protein SRAE_2000138800 [Strongyloides ratti]CEF66721.1 Hypothetical protein SRAE_2000138800 [Strongyloides ratti]
MSEKNKLCCTLTPIRKDVIINEITKKISELCNDTQNTENKIYFVKEEEKGDVIGNTIRDVLLDYEKYFIQLIAKEKDFFNSKMIDNAFVSRILCDSKFRDSNIDFNNIVKKYNLTLDKESEKDELNSLSSSHSSSSSLLLSSYHSTSSNTNTTLNNLKLDDLASKVADEILRKMPSQESSNEMLKALITEIGNICKQPRNVISNQQIDTGVQTFFSPSMTNDILKLNKNDNLNEKELKNVALQTSIITTTTEEGLSSTSKHSQDTLSSFNIPSNILSSEDSSTISKNHSPGQIDFKNIHNNHDFIVYEVNIDGSIANVNKNNVYNLDDIPRKKRYSPNDKNYESERNFSSTTLNRDREKYILKIEEIQLDSTDNENISEYNNIASKDNTSVCSKNKNIKRLLDNGSTTTTTLSSISSIPNSI